MGGCATKPRELKEEEAPRPIEEKAEVPVQEKAVAVVATETEPANDVGVGVDDSQRKSLGHLFKESEEGKVESPETEEVTVKEAIIEPAVETKEEEQPKTQEPPADEKFITPVPEETPAASEEATATEEKHVDSSSDVVEEQTPKVEAVVSESPEVEQKEEVAATEKGNAVEAVVAEPLKVEQKEAVTATEEGNAELQVTTSSTEKVVVEELPPVA